MTAAEIAPIAVTRPRADPTPWSQGRASRLGLVEKNGVPVHLRMLGGCLLCGHGLLTFAFGVRGASAARHRSLSGTRYAMVSILLSPP